MPDDAELVVTLRLKKTWEHEREVMSDRSTLALYFADADAVPVTTADARRMAVAPASPGPLGTSEPWAAWRGGVAAGVDSAADMRVLAVYPTAGCRR